MSRAIDQIILRAAIDAAIERHEAAVALCRAYDAAVHLAPNLGVQLGPVSAHHAQVAREAVAHCERRYLDASSTASRYASAAGRSLSFRELVSK